MLPLFLWACAPSPPAPPGDGPASPEAPASDDAFDCNTWWVQNYEPGTVNITVVGWFLAGGISTRSTMLRTDADRRTLIADGLLSWVDAAGVVTPLDAAPGRRLVALRVQRMGPPLVEATFPLQAGEIVVDTARCSDGWWYVGDTADGLRTLHGPGRSLPLSPDSGPLTCGGDAGVGLLLRGEEDTWLAPTSGRSTTMVGQELVGGIQGGWLFLDRGAGQVLELEGDGARRELQLPEEAPVVAAATDGESWAAATLDGWGDLTLYRDGGYWGGGATSEPSATLDLSVHRDPWLMWREARGERVWWTASEGSGATITYPAPTNDLRVLAQLAGLPPCGDDAVVLLLVGDARLTAFANSTDGYSLRGCSAPSLPLHPDETVLLDAALVGEGEAWVDIAPGGRLGSGSGWPDDAPTIVHVAWTFDNFGLLVCD
jgi:hypothetical protein